MEIKEIRLRPMIDDNDFGIKINQARRFLQDGDKVKVTLRFRGREMSHQELGGQVLARARVPGGCRQDRDDAQIRGPSDGHGDDPQQQQAPQRPKHIRPVDRPFVCRIDALAMDGAFLEEASSIYSKFNKNGMSTLLSTLSRPPFSTIC